MLQWSSNLKSITKKSKMMNKFKMMNNYKNNKTNKNKINKLQLWLIKDNKNENNN